MYEYLLHIGAQKSAQTFLSEVSWLGLATPAPGPLLPGSAGAAAVVPDGPSEGPRNRGLAHRRLSVRGTDVCYSALVLTQLSSAGFALICWLPSPCPLPEVGRRVGGSQQTAQWLLTCLPSPVQIRWEKNITLGEPPGFLHSWWWYVRGWCGQAVEGLGEGYVGKPSFPPATHSVFWDLYCAAPDRREACEHSSEAKAFQDYVSPALGTQGGQGGGAWGGGAVWPMLGPGWLGAGVLPR